MNSSMSSNSQHAHDEQSPTDIPLEQTCYDVAYFVLPQYIAEDLEKITDMCLNMPNAAGPFFYILACINRKIEPNIEVSKTFRWHYGTFDEQRHYLTLEYPTPAPIDFDINEISSMAERSRPLILAPYYSAILWGDDLEPEYYILGQAPIAGETTIRSVVHNHMNVNLGPGPEPTLDGFLDAIRQRRAGRESK